MLPSPTASLSPSHSHKTILDTSTFVCWSVHGAAVQLDSAEKQPRKRKKYYFQDSLLFLSGSLCSCTNTTVHTKKEPPSFRWEHQLLIWLICSLTVFCWSTNKTTGHLRMHSSNIETYFLLKAILKQFLQLSL